MVWVQNSYQVVKCTTAEVLLKGLVEENSAYDKTQYYLDKSFAGYFSQD